jgi:hypothetical protein
VAPEEVHYTSKELQFSNSYKQRFGNIWEHVWEYLMVWDNGGRNIKLDQAKFMN